MKISKFLIAVSALVYLPCTFALVVPDTELVQHGAVEREPPVNVVGNIDVSIPRALEVTVIAPQEVAPDNVTFFQEEDHVVRLDKRESLTSRATLQQISDADYNALKCKGQTLVYCMSVDKATAQPYILQGQALDSLWTDVNALQSWGWTLDVMATNTWNWGLRPKDLKDAFKQYGISTMTDANHKYYPWVHDRETTHDGKKYPAINVEMKNSISLRDGLIMQDTNQSPRSKAGSSATLPNLQRLSDILFLSWKKELLGSGLSSVPLRFVIAHKVSNQITLALLVRGAKAAGRQVKNDNLDDRSCSDFSWGKRMGWGTDTEMGHVLVASPNGLAQAMLLIQHKDVFGVRTRITYVEFFCTGSSAWDWSLNMAYHVTPG